MAKIALAVLITQRVAQKSVAHNLLGLGLLSKLRNDGSIPARGLCIVCSYLFCLHCDHYLNPLNPELNPICYLLAILAHHFLHVSRMRAKLLTFRRLMSYIYIWSIHS